jgi:hypothetical protein
VKSASLGIPGSLAIWMTGSDAEGYGGNCATMTREIPRLSDEAFEVRKQFAAYADAITAFATAQLVGFILLMAHGDCFTRNVLNGYWYAVCVGAVVNAGYFVLIFLCHREANKFPSTQLSSHQRCVVFRCCVI